MISEHFGRRATAVVQAQQRRIDAIVATARDTSAPEVRRPLYRDPPKVALKPSTDLIDQRVAEELEFARRLLDATGDRLVDDPILLHRHQTVLQNFDLVAQLLENLAKVVGSEDRVEAIDRIGMSDLRARLQRPGAAVEPGGALARLHRSSSNPFAAG